MKIQIVGIDSLACKVIENSAFQACSELRLPSEEIHIYRTKETGSLRVRKLPAVVIDGQVVVSGRVPTLEELKQAFQARLSEEPARDTAYDLFAPTGQSWKSQR